MCWIVVSLSALYWYLLIYTDILFCFLFIIVYSCFAAPIYLIQSLLVCMLLISLDHIDHLNIHWHIVGYSFILRWFKGYSSSTYIDNHGRLSVVVCFHGSSWFFWIFWCIDMYRYILLYIYISPYISSYLSIFFFWTCL